MTGNEGEKRNGNDMQQRSLARPDLGTLQLMVDSFGPWVKQYCSTL